MPGLDGFKTGFTNAAGYNLAASAVRDGRRLITVVLGGSSGGARNANVEDLLLTGFDVEERRARGETITVAQNLFEQPPAEGRLVPAGRPGRRGRPDRHGADRRRARRAGHLPARAGHPAGRPASGPRGRAAAQLRLHRRHRRPARRRPPPARATGRSQVGEYGSSKLATRQVDHVADTFKAMFDDREGEVDQVGGSYRAVFTGFTEAEARSACSAVAASKVRPARPAPR